MMHTCCAEFEKAKQDATDNEGWEALLWVDKDDGGKLKIGSDLAAIRFCPWCGTTIGIVAREVRPFNWRLFCQSGEELT